METRKGKTKVVAAVLALAALCMFSLFAVGGNLEPSAPPGPTMKTLDEVEPRTPIGPNTTPGDATCVYKITQPGSYYLTENLVVNSLGSSPDGISIEADNVTLDLKGFTIIDLSRADDGIVVNGPHKNIAISNGTVTDFTGDGVDAGNGESCHFEGLRLSDNDGFGIRLGTDSTASNCVAKSNGASGFYAAAATGCLVSNCVASGNGGTGISVGDGSTVICNRTYNNQTFGIVGGFGSTLTSNTAHDNQKDGIFAKDGSTVNGNTAYSNGQNGIFASLGTTITGNTTYLNGLYGISLSTNSLVDQNTAVNNTSANFKACGTCTYGTNHAP